MEEPLRECREQCVTIDGEDIDIMETMFTVHLSSSNPPSQRVIRAISEDYEPPPPTETLDHGAIHAGEGDANNNDYNIDGNDLDFSGMGYNNNNNGSSSTAPASLWMGLLMTILWFCVV